MTADSEPAAIPSPPADSPLVEHEGGYALEGYRGGDKYYAPVTNFRLEVRSFLTRPDGESEMDLVVHPQDEPAYAVTVQPGVFNHVRTFKDAVVTGRTTTFSGSQDALDHLREFLGRQDARERTGVQHLGWHGDEWVIPDGALTADGWAQEPATVYLSRGIGVERKVSLTPSAFEPADIDHDAVAKVLELLPQTRDSERFLPVLGWYYATPCRPQIMGWTSQFNLLNVLGDTGAGKTATLGVLSELFGLTDEPLSVDDTPFAHTVTMAATHSIPVWYDEYKPAAIPAYKVNAFHDLIRKSTRGGIAQRGNRDGSTDEYHMRAPVVISGEQRLQGPAENRRAIPTTFRTTVTDPGTPTAQAYAELNGESYRADGVTKHPPGYRDAFPQHALAYCQFLLGQDRAALEGWWYEAGETVTDLLETYDLAGIESFPEQGLQTVVFGCHLYRVFAAAMGANLDAAGVVTDENLAEAVVYVARQVGADGHRRSHLDELVELSARAAAAGYLREGDHHAFVNEGTDTEELRLNLNVGLDQITKYVRDHDVAGEDLLDRKQDYDARIADAVDDPDSYITVASQPTRGINRAVGIHVATATAMLENFEKSYFTETDTATPAATDDSGSLAVSTTPLGDAEPGDGYTDLSVTVATLTRDTPDGMRKAGTLQDETGTLDFVEWLDDDPDKEGVVLDKDQAYHIEEARVTTDPDGATQIELKPGVTTTRLIGTGVGHTALADSGPDQTLPAATRPTRLDVATEDAGGADEGDTAEGTGDAGSQQAKSSVGNAATATKELAQDDLAEHLRDTVADLSSADEATDGVLLDDVFDHLHANGCSVTRDRFEQMIGQWVVRGDLIQTDQGVRLA